MTKPKAIDCKKLVAFVLTIITKGVDPMPNEKLEKLKHDQYVAERKLTAAKHKEKRLESEIKHSQVQNQAPTEEGVREFDWMRYDLKTGAVTRGTGNDLISDWRNPDACTPTSKE